MSHPIRTLALLSLSLLVTTVASCGGGTRGTSGQGVPEPIALVRLLDADTPLVGHVDMDGLRQSPYYGLVRDALMSSLNEAQRGELNNVLTLLDRADHIVVGLNPTQRQTVILVRGSFQTSELDLLGAPEEQFTHRHHLLRGDSNARGVATPDALILGATEPVLRALDRLDGLAAATGPTLAGFPEAAERVQLGEHDAGVVVMLTDEMRGELGQFGPRAVEQQLRESGLAVGVSADARNGIRLSGFITASSAEAVRAIAQELRGMIAAAQGDMFVSMLGLSALLQQIEITDRGTDLLVEFRLDDQQVRGLLERFGPLLQALMTSF